MPLTASDRIFVVTGADLANEIAAQLPELGPDQIVAEPVGRGTAMAIATAGCWVAARDRNATLVTVGSDHHIGNEEEFRACLDSAAVAAGEISGLLTVGVVPTLPDTGLGYIAMGPRVGRFAQLPVHAVEKFVEKPDLPTAQAYLNAGGHLWNCNYFAFTVPALLSALARHAPHLHVRTKALTAAFANGDPAAGLDVAYAGLRSEAIDTAIMEKAANVFTVPAGFEWADIGSWSGVYVVARPVDSDGNMTSGHGSNEPIFVDSRDCLVDAQHSFVGLVGLENVVVVEAGDAILVCNRDHSQQVSQLLAALRASGQSDKL